MRKRLRRLARPAETADQDGAARVGEALFRNLMAATPAPVTVVSTLTADGPAGATVSAFMSLSMQPTLIAIALCRPSRLLALIEQERAFGVNLLAEAQSDHALLFAQPAPDRFGDVPWVVDHGQPRLEGTAAWIVCDLDASVAAGDHRLLMARVRHGACASEPPLVYSHRLFGTNSSMHSRVVPPLESSIAALSRLAL